LGTEAPAGPLTREADGYFSGVAPGVGPGSLYRYRLDGDQAFPDPASRFQPQGPNGPSQVIDPSGFRWTDDAWQGVTAHGQVLYEMHVGTFTADGTWAAATAQLPLLKELGITCLEVMPVAEFAGTFGWGYDGVDQYAPFHHYGAADAFRAFVNEAHRLGIGVILDLVYNHFGPDGNYVNQYSDDYFNAEHATDWGEALNFDGRNSKPVREFFVCNIEHWIREYHVDGFRFDATQAIVDTSSKHLLAEITERAHEAAAGRSVYLINENEPQNTTLVRPIAEGGYGMDALWNDDFHHSAMVALSGHREAYYTDHPATAQEFVSAAKWGYLYQGQRYRHQKRRRGTPSLDLPPTAFVHFLQNHDQIANSGRGYRAHHLASPGQLRAMTAFMLLMPQTPMLFQGQEFAASSTFHYFADHQPDLAKLVKAGRAKELSQFPSVATADMIAGLFDPADPQTFQRSKIDYAEREKPGHAQVYELHKDLLALRQSERAFRRVQRRGDIDGAVLGANAFVLRYFCDACDDRLLIVNLGNDLELDVVPEPLLAPPMGKRWSIVWSSEHPKYGGSGTPPLDTELEGWFIRGRCTVVLQPLPAEQAEVQSRKVAEGSAQAPRRKEQSGANPA
jgi:maltooligosyltrehalose trehalohydrolase